MNEQTGEIWTGEVHKLPTDRPDQELFAKPSMELVDETTAVVDLFGLVGRAEWQKFAWAIDAAIDSGAKNLAIKIGTLCQEARGIGDAIEQVKRATYRMNTKALVYDTAGVASLIPQECDQFILCEGCYFNPSKSTRTLYGDSRGLPQTKHVAMFCGNIAGTVEKIAQEALDSGKQSVEELATVMSYFYPNSKEIIR